MHCPGGNRWSDIEVLNADEKERSYARKNVVSWTAIVVAYARCRYLEGVRGLFEIRPELAVAEHGIALVTMARNVPQACVSIKQGRWQRNKYVGVSLVGKTPAVMDFGKVGSEFARGSVIDKDAMVRVLDNVVAALVGLDVFREESLAKDNKLVQHKSDASFRCKCSRRTGRSSHRNSRSCCWGCERCLYSSLFHKYSEFQYE
ncbi:hypothetical protein SUGI_1089340 [Cryptomeria japonica]|nr:hypothetical protein SUGI_1089340 [Cryptomeria japonica]